MVSKEPCAATVKKCLTRGGQQKTRNGQQRALCAALDEFEVAVEDVGKEAVDDARNSKRSGALLCARVPAAKKKLTDSKSAWDFVDSAC